jgi:hypothetical protein
MADHKITQLVEHTTPILGIDLMPLVSDTLTTPENYKVQVKNFLSQIEIDLPQTTRSALKITASITADANAAAFAAGEFNLVANSSVGVTVEDRRGLIVRNLIQNGNSVVEGRMSAAEFTLDVGDSTVDAANTYGIVIDHTLDDNTASTRTIAPRAYVGIFEYAGNAAPDNVKTTYLLDVGGQGKHVSEDTANANPFVVISAIGAAAASHALKIAVNGVDYWVLASNVAPA